MSRLLVTIFSVLLLTVLVCAGCAASPTSSAAPSPTAAPAPAQPVELKFAITVAPDSPNGKNYQAWADKVKELSGGKVVVKCYFASSLLTMPEMFRGIRSGLADLGMYYPGIEGGLLQLNSYPEMNFLNLGDYRKGSQLVLNLNKSFPELDKEWADAGLKMYKPNLFPGYQLHTTKKAVKSPSDLKGMKIISTGGPLSLAIAKGGGAPLDLPVSEYYTSLEKGLADGIVTFPGLLSAFKVTELVPYHTFFGDSGCTTRNSVFAFNLNSWKKLSPDAQKVLNDLEPEIMEKSAIGYDDDTKLFNSIVQKAGHTIINLTPEEIKPWSDIYATEHDEWAAKAEAAGKPGKALLAQILKLTSK